LPLHDLSGGLFDPSRCFARSLPLTILVNISPVGNPRPQWLSHHRAQAPEYRLSLQQYDSQVPGLIYQAKALETSL